MSATKMLWGQVITVFLIVLAAVWGATQWTAAALAYQPELGPPWFADNILSALATIGLALRIKCVPAIVVVTPRAGAIEQSDADHSLHADDVTAERRLFDIECPCGAIKATVIGGGDGVTKLANIKWHRSHAAGLWQRASPLPIDRSPIST